MAGKNLYESAIGQFGSIREAKQQGFIKGTAAEGPIIFLSHIRADKEMVKAFAEHIKNRGIDYYLDVEDEELQKAEAEGDHAKVTEFIEAGIRRSTDVMIFLSPSTRTSWWVPYEIGFGKSAQKGLVCVKLKDVKVGDLSFLKIVRLLANRKEFVAYIDELRPLQRKVRKVLNGSGKGKGVEYLVEIGEMVRKARAENRTPGFHSLDCYMEQG